LHRIVWLLLIFVVVLNPLVTTNSAASPPAGPSAARPAGDGDTALPPARILANVDSVETYGETAGGPPHDWSIPTASAPFAVAAAQTPTALATPERATRFNLHGPPVPVDPNPPRVSRAPVPDTLAQPVANRQGSIAAPTDFTLFANTSLSNGETSSTDEPAVSGNGNVILYTGNWYGALSTNAGRSFTLIDPFSQFPQVYGGFCCDQRTIYDPTRDLTFWSLLYLYDFSFNNELRLVAFAGQSNLSNLQGYYYDLTPQLAGWPSGDWFDYPQLALSANYLQVTVNVFDSSQNLVGSTAFHLSLDQIAQKAPTLTPTFNNFTGADSVDAVSPIQGASTTMYFAAHLNSAMLRVYAVPEAGGPATIFDVPHTAYPGAGNVVYTCPVVDGTNPCAFDDDRIKGGWVSKGVLGFLWDASQGTGGLGLPVYPFPYVHVVRINQASMTLIDEPLISSSTYAWFYPAVAPNGRGDLGLSLGFAGGCIAPSSAVGVHDSYTASSGAGFWLLNTVRNGTNGPASNRWGDYFSVQPASGNGVNIWLGTSFTLQGPCSGGGQSCPSGEPRFLWFGRQQDDPFVPHVSTATPTPPATPTATPTVTPAAIIYLPLLANGNATC
jgi:hypothetical protein